MNTLYLLRHAKASPQNGGEDRDRLLDDQGRRGARRLAGWIAERRLAPELVLCSPAVRTRETLDLVLPALGRRPRVLYEDLLYLADARQLLAQLRRVPPGTRGVLMVVHNPGVQELATLLADETAGPLLRRLAEAFPTGALAGYEVGVPWAALDRRRAHLATYVTPKDLSATRD